MRHDVVNYILQTQLETETPQNAELRSAGLDYITQTPKKLLGLSLHPFVGEFVGARLMRRLGIGAPEDVRLADKQAAREAIATGAWIPKIYKDGRLRATDELGISDVNILIKRIRGAISLYDLRVKHGICGRELVLTADFSFDEGKGLIESIVTNGVRGQLLNQLACGIRNGKEHSNPIPSDFVLPLDTSKIVSAIQWDSPQMLRIHSARLFLGCSAAHAGNVLVDADGKLYSVDHESCAATDGEELELLFDNVQRDTRTWWTLRGVAGLSHENIVALFADIPESAHWPLGSKQTTVNYFTGRLDYWKFRYANG